MGGSAYRARGTRGRVQVGPLVGAALVLGVCAALMLALVIKSHAQDKLQLTRPPKHINWEDPLIGGTPAHGIGGANRQLAFHAVAPVGLASVPNIYVSDPHQFAKAQRELALSYTDPVHGRFLVLQRPSDFRQAELEGLVSHNGDGDPTHFSLVKLSSGRTALLETGENTTSIEWLWGPVNVVVVGPSGSFSAQDALAVAELVLKAESAAT